MLHDAHVSQHKTAKKKKKSYQTKADEFAEFLVYTGLL